MCCWKRFPILESNHGLFNSRRIRHLLPIENTVVGTLENMLPLRGTHDKGGKGRWREKLRRLLRRCELTAKCNREKNDSYSPSRRTNENQFFLVSEVVWPAIKCGIHVYLTLWSKR